MYKAIYELKLFKAKLEGEILGTRKLIDIGLCGGVQIKTIESIIKKLSERIELLSAKKSNIK